MISQGHFIWRVIVGVPHLCGPFQAKNRLKAGLQQGQRPTFGQMKCP